MAVSSHLSSSASVLLSSSCIWRGLAVSRYPSNKSRPSRFTRSPPPPSDRRSTVREATADEDTISSRTLEK